MIRLKVSSICSPRTGIQGSKSDSNTLFCSSHTRYIVVVDLSVTKKAKKCPTKPQKAMEERVI
jgi:hypothetical protein